MLNESRRLFEEPTFKIIAHALNIHRSDLKSELKPKKIVKSSKNIIEIDINDMYYSKVKSIYSRIIEFGTLAVSKFSLTPQQAESINIIRDADRQAVEAIKLARQLQKKIDKYMMSENMYMDCKLHVESIMAQIIIRFVPFTTITTN